MGGNGGFEGEIQLPGGSFSRLLLSSDDVDDKKCVLFSSNTPQMLSFGDFASPKFTTVTTPNTNLTTTFSNSNKRRNGSGKESGLRSENGQNQQKKNGMKKNKQEMGPIVSASLPGHAKQQKQGRREKLGERITVLQQLVSPYGKTDTASVLHEAMGYIRFLHEQVKVLSTPYLNRLPSSSSLSPRRSNYEEAGLKAKGKNSTEGLRSRGLCLVPVECIIQVANSNGADFWSSAAISSLGP